MHKLTFYPLGNADSCRIDLENGKKLLIDFADKKDPEDQEDLRCDLPALLREDLEEAGRDYYDVVAITHLDDDHFRGASEFFWFDHAKKYQGEDRIKIDTLWVPADVITEKGVEDTEAKIIQKEARHRFKNGSGIRVFSRPEGLRAWCDDNGISFDERKELITDAGKTVPEFSLHNDGVEFFVHSPFAKRLNEDEVEDRNTGSIVLQGTFRVASSDTRVLLFADTPHENLSEIVLITRDVKKHPDRLKWDVAKLPHHCSYRSLGQDKGEDKTEPTDEISWLWSKQGEDKGVIVSTSKPIPVKGTDEDKDKNPPHRQAANYYQEVTGDLDGDFVVTMEWPKQNDPKPLVIEIGSLKAKLKRGAVTASVIATTQRSPRAG